MFFPLRTLRPLRFSLWLAAQVPRVGLADRSLSDGVEVNRCVTQRDGNSLGHDSFAFETPGAQALELVPSAVGAL